MPLVFGRSILGFGVVAGPPAPTWTDPDLANGSYDSVSFSVASQSTFPADLAVSSDGTKMYIAHAITQSGATGDTIFQYTLSTAWDVSTMSYASKSFSTSSQTNYPYGLAFSNDGTKMYVGDISNDDIYQYTLSTAWDVSTASYANKSFDISTQLLNVGGIAIKTDGTKVYAVGATSDAVFQYSLSTAFDISTASYDSVTLNVKPQGGQPQGIAFNPDGNRFYISEGVNDAIREYDLTTAWDLSTASYSGDSLDVSGQETTPIGVVVKSDGSKMYVVGSAADTIFQYSTVASAWTNPDLTTASYDSVSFSTASQDFGPQAIFFKSDGMTAYIAGATNDTVFQYTLSTAWDLSTISYASKSFSVASQEIAPQGLFFKDDGSKMYVVGSVSDSVFEYDLSTAWDVSTASYNSVSFSVATQEPVPFDLSFKNDGTKFYIVGWNAGGKVHEYNLSTAWDMSTASFNQSLDINSQETTPTGIFMAPTGERAYVVGSNDDDVNEYSLSTAWDISTASFLRTFSVSSQDVAPKAVFFKSDGSKMYIVGDSNNAVFQYST